MKLSKTLLTGAVLAALSPFTMAASFTNGGFESSTFSGSFATYWAGSLDLTGWTIEEGSVDLINNYWQPSSGDYSLDLSGNGDGVISQAFDTVVGTTYTVSFDMAGNPDDSDKVKTVQVGLSQQPLYTFNTTGRTRTDMGWVTQSFTFTAVATSSTLHFASVQDSAYGVALDNISVTAVPEPETYAMRLAGLGLIGTLARRRKSSSK